MNSRGKSLTRFENFKSKMLKKYDEQKQSDNTTSIPLRSYQENCGFTNIKRADIASHTYGIVENDMWELSNYGYPVFISATGGIFN